jgi:putative tryptophan/tyrosine transport system substrate-binding protein
MPRTAALALPAIYQWPTVPAEGALIGYGPRLERIYGDIISRQLVKLLRGTKPADIPVEQPTKFDLAVNLKTARKLGLTIPNSALTVISRCVDQRHVLSRHWAKALGISGREGILQPKKKMRCERAFRSA